jgi:hypothetical protein
MAWPDPGQIAHVLIHNRVRAVELFDFDYSLEMYKPAADRRWDPSRCRCCMAIGRSEGPT